MPNHRSTILITNQVSTSFEFFNIRRSGSLYNNLPQRGFHFVDTECLLFTNSSVRVVNSSTSTFYIQNPNFLTDRYDLGSFISKYLTRYFHTIQSRFLKIVCSAALSHLLAEKTRTTCCHNLLYRVYIKLSIRIFRFIGRTNIGLIITLY